MSNMARHGRNQNKFRSIQTFDDIITFWTGLGLYNGSKLNLKKKEYSMPQKALKFDIEVTKKGRVELPVSFAPGSRVTVFVIENPNDKFDDLLNASQSSLGFWDNQFDDEDWNDA
jgi:hypothetical protein